MASLNAFLTEKKYKRIKLHTTITRHLELKARINGVRGSFILDTGASSSCVDFGYAAHFKLLTEASEVKAAGAGATDMHTELSKNNTLKIGSWRLSTLNLVLFDLSHVNAALKNHNAQPVHGILGADVLKAGRGIIDYQYSCLYLKQL